MSRSFSKKEIKRKLEEKRALKERAKRKEIDSTAVTKHFLDSNLDIFFYYKLKSEIIKESYFEFFKWSFSIIHPTEPYSDAPHIKELCDLLQSEVMRMIDRIRKKKDVIINIPPRTSKSLIVSVSLLPWVWIHDPSIKMISISYDESLVITNSRLCKDIIQSSEYQEMFGHIYQLRSDSTSVAYFRNNNGGSRLSKTTGSSIVGHGGAIIVVDDPQSPQTARSEVERERIRKYYSENLYNRLTPAQTGIRIVIQQRLHEKDLTGYLLDKNSKKYNHFNLPATITDENKHKVKPARLVNIYKWIDGVGYLDPIRLDKLTLSDVKDQLGSYGYSSQYDQEPENEEGGIIKKDWFVIKRPHDIVRDRNLEPIHFFLDTAYTEKTQNDPTGILAAFKRGNEVYIVRSESKRLEFPDLCKYIVDFVNSYGYDGQSRIYVEPKASGKSVVQQLKSTTMLNIIEGEPPRDDKISRVASVSPIVEARRVTVIEGGWNDNFFSQICGISEEKMPPHDDEADCFTMAIRKLLISGDFDFMFL